MSDACARGKKTCGDGEASSAGLLMALGDSISRAKKGQLGKQQ